MKAKNNGLTQMRKTANANVQKKYTKILVSMMPNRGKTTEWSVQEFSRWGGEGANRKNKRSFLSDFLNCFKTV